MMSQTVININVTLLDSWRSFF